MAPYPTTPSNEDKRIDQIKKAFDESKAGVKGLSDSGITTIPDIFVQPPQPHHSSNLTIPVIDFSNLSSPTHRPQIIQQLRDAAATWGFFQLINHGIPISTIYKTIAAVRSFHDQPKEVKAKHYVRQELGGVMYASNNDLFRAKAATWHDFLQVWMSPMATPEEEIPEACRREVVEWEVWVRKVGEEVMELLSLGLGLEGGKLKELSFSGVRIFEGIIYPYCPQPDRTVGIKSHTDPGVLTLLVQNEVQGLQVMHGEEWVDVKPLHGGLIVNIGDMLQIVSNGLYKSVNHRVLANSCREPRISVVMFFNLTEWRESEGGTKYYGPLPELLTAEKPRIYRDFTEKEFLDNFYSKGLDSKSLIHKITI